MDPILLGVFGNLSIVFAFAYLVESLVEMVWGTLEKIVLSIFPGIKPYWTADLRIAIIQLTAMGAGIAGAFVFRFDILYILSLFLSTYTGQIMLTLTPFGMIITGLAIGRGSNFIHQFVGKFFPPKDIVIDENAIQSWGGKTVTVDRASINLVEPKVAEDIVKRAAG